HWNLPGEFTALIERHTDIESLATTRASDAGQLAVALSSLLPAVNDEGWPEIAGFERYFRELVPASLSMEAFLESIDTEFVNFAPVLKITAPAQSLVAHYREMVRHAG
ncbi:MAG: HDOD domain-containing protein, partial [Pirellulales bacterium]